MAFNPQVRVVTFKRRELFEEWREEVNKEKRNEAVYNYILRNLNLKNISESEENILSNKCENLCKQFRAKWLDCHHSVVNFNHKHSHWLDDTIRFGELYPVNLEQPSTSSGPGRPKSEFTESSQSTKRRKVKPLLEKSHDELGFALQASLRSLGLRTSADMVKKVLESPEEVKDLKKRLEPQNSPTKLTSDEALASIIKNKLTKSQYIGISKDAKSHNADIYPNYNEVLSAKKRCYPDDITITEISAQVSVQSLLDHTINRLVLVQKPVLQQVYSTSGNEVIKIRSVFKWGCDGAAGQQNYKQRFSEEAESVKCDDSFLFVISCVPLRLYGEHDSVLWCNQRPSSTSFCRPIKLLFKKETEEVVRQEVASIREQIDNLKPTSICIEGLNLEVSHTLHLTMIDGKIGNILTGTPTTNCVICKANPSAMNNLGSHSKRELDSEAMTFGMSSLHALIKCFECILHISYKLEINKWRAGKEDKELIKARKAHIQDRLRKEMGLLVDIPKPGYGTTNDGNTARRFFKDPKLASEIIGVDETLIWRMSVVLRTLTSGLPVDSSKFGKYCFETAKLYVSLYNWYYMPPTVHKLLIHGELIVKKSIVPIGQMSEEAQEAKHKDLKLFRRDNTRKMSRKQTMEDLFHMGFLTSDPVISSMIRVPPKKSGPLPLEVIGILESPEMNSDSSESDLSDFDE